MMTDTTYAETRAEAKALGYPRYYTGKPCGRGHVTDRHTSTGGCIECIAEDQKKNRPTRRRALKRNPLKHAAKMARYWAGRVERLKSAASKREARQ